MLAICRNNRTYYTHTVKEFSIFTATNIALKKKTPRKQKQGTNYMYYKIAYESIQIPKSIKQPPFRYVYAARPIDTYKNKRRKGFVLFWILIGLARTQQT